MMSTGPFELQQFLDSGKFGRYLNLRLHTCKQNFELISWYCIDEMQIGLLTFLPRYRRKY